ncbi:aminotransferase class I/II-fold pyridoxal phosphate-dependent enzyme [Exilibacterium tricleocarpae]|uniref:Aminotransferase class I/II-fold pyridoxal phosphate-dependent enzyme n=1 Tax=Exilibacterium tricleocarpae TaxID=2591008 RepID=A0A545U5R7_9GAMM|nr:aminotransferase class I/II-fold pyridoxal phosphate-dependent enzyme [Exilibacterium tricleocarpae]TQV84811.1 aminotransferase class I/II-fold pyridoxal phosphate-dependent enzyme [Exilibacterium tricleocarpae]
MQLDQATAEKLQQWERDLNAEYEQLQSRSLNLDLTRGKPSAEQLSLSNAMDGILAGDYTSADGTDTRNYGGIDGIKEMKRLGAEILQVDDGEVLVGGNSSLTLMFQAVLHAYLFGFDGPQSAWSRQQPVQFVCPVPGYDRHFAICEQLGIEMLTVPMTAAGPDMDALENLVRNDPAIKGLWCVPKYSNPTGAVYSAAVVERIAGLGRIAGAGFRVFWDNAYAVHDLGDTPAALASIMDCCRKQGTEDSVIQFASTSKITFAGAGVAFMAASAANLNAFKGSLGIATIGPDKVNQLRHARLFPSLAALHDHMRKHAQIIKPRFACVLDQLEAAFGHCDLGRWESGSGGYFISFSTRPGLAAEVVRLAAAAGVKLTPAGATFPYGRDPDDSNIRIAPTVPNVAELDTAMQVFVICVKLASVRQAIATRQ